MDSGPGDRQISGATPQTTPQTEPAPNKAKSWQLTASHPEPTAMGINKREEGKKVNSNINVTPMVDVMLVLLIIFMVITPMLNNKVNVDLPTVSASTVMENANKEDAITV